MTSRATMAWRRSSLVLNWAPLIPGATFGPVAAGAGPCGVSWYSGGGTEGLVALAALAASGECACTRGLFGIAADALGKAGAGGCGKGVFGCGTGSLGCDVEV